MKNSLGLILTLLAVFVWGISFVSTKIVMNDLPPVSIAFFRQFVALVPLMIMVRIKREKLHIERKELYTFVTATLFGIVLYFVFENTGLYYTSAASASMLVSAIPVFALIAESISKKSRIDFFSLVCIIASIIGVYLVVFEGGAPDFNSSSFFGNLLVMGAMVSWIIYTFLSKKLGTRYSSLKMTTIQTYLSIPLFIPFILNEIKNWKVPSFEGLLNLSFLGVFCSALAYVFFLYGIKVLGPVLPSALLNLTPVITLLTSAIILKEDISLHHFLGALLIIGSLSLLSYMRTRKESITKKGDSAKLNLNSN